MELLAHAGEVHGEPLALAAIAIAAMVIPLIVLGFVARAFWRAAKRDAEREARGH
jgi:cbb3-type cytochrome oxidase subunit 3